MCTYGPIAALDSLPYRTHSLISLHSPEPLRRSKHNSKQDDEYFLVQRVAQEDIADSVKAYIKSSELGVQAVLSYLPFNTC
jgi:hypothetical protein